MNLEEILLRWDLLFSPEHLSDNSREPQAEKKKDGANTGDFDHRWGEKMTEMEGHLQHEFTDVIAVCCEVAEN